jgi:outer membrane protein assembly factor BamB
MAKNCIIVRKEIELYVLDGLDVGTRRRVQQHLLRCPACQTLERQCRFLICAFGQQCEASPVNTQALNERICSASRAHIQGLRQQKGFQYYALAVKSVAAVFIAILAVWSLWPDTVTLAEPRKTVWQKTDTIGTGEDLAVRDGLVFFLQQQENSAFVTAAQAVSGAVLWKSAVASLGYLETDRQQVYCVTRAGPMQIELVALDQETGQMRWTFGPRRGLYPLGRSWKPTSISAGRICWITGNRVYAINAATGTVEWQRSLVRERRLSRAQVMRGKVFVAGQRSIYCLNGRNGMLRWQLDCQASADSETYPLLGVGRHHLFVVTDVAKGQSRIQCINLRSRKCCWEKIVPRTSHLHACAESGQIYLRCQGVMALDQKSGTQRWQVQARGCGPITVCDGLVCFVDQSREGHLVAIHGGNGIMAWHVPGLHSGQAFLKAGNCGFLKTLDSTVLAFAFEN